MPQLPQYNLVDVLSGEIYLAQVTVENGKIAAVDRLGDSIDQSLPYLMPGFVDSHIQAFVWRFAASKPRLLSHKRWRF